MKIINSESSNLIRCKDCGKTMSKEASHCPKCGSPNKKHINKKRGNTQGCGCGLIILGSLLGLVAPPAGGLLALVGIVILIVGLFIQ